MANLIFSILKSDQSTFHRLHECDWEKDINLKDFFTLCKKENKV